MHKRLGAMPSGKEIMNGLESVGGLFVGGVIANKTQGYIQNILPANIPPVVVPAGQFLAGMFVMLKSKSPFVISLAGGVAVAGLMGIGKIYAPGVVSGLMGIGYGGGGGGNAFDENRYDQLNGENTIMGSNTIMGYKTDADCVAY